jgi:uncharacterized membrane protein
MGTLVLGLVCFLGVHVFPTLTAARANLTGVCGENKYKGLFTAISAVGLILIVIGYARAPTQPRLFAPYPGAIAVAPFAMIVSFILLVASHMKTHIRAWIKHPMLAGVGIWSLVHLLGNGQARSTLLFGAFLAYIIVDLLSVSQRKTAKTFQPVIKHDLIAVAAGSLLAIAVMAVHGPLMGTKVVAWGF